ncbi:hypothetical protein PHYSODRAFT_333465 [Phytophthora sojae]|uniref:Uncharacterized protein n=1 Tax=Phytophthora sojae (strain P6497) TaxID=1094619 RepID=G4ZQF7_PHYSP|nr:hypothetical protein PHYSODRAFT_333465 [Phytophthora sojae]EGZ15192.1 hypothetical protein PHYSODRAFT_333465 [Phytophthora sojae]|eukprot:XP_009528941.1 hypothetical protein PHYSODRAFT_333465 [Phytophthora sojae]
MTMEAVPTVRFGDDRTQDRGRDGDIGDYDEEWKKAELLSGAAGTAGVSPLAETCQPRSLLLRTAEFDGLRSRNPVPSTKGWTTGHGALLQVAESKGFSTQQSVPGTYGNTGSQRWRDFPSCLARLAPNPGRP